MLLINLQLMIPCNFAVISFSDSQVFIGMPGQRLGLILVKCKSEFYDASRSFDCGISWQHKHRILEMLNGFL